MKEEFEIFENFPIEGISFVDINSVLIDNEKRNILSGYLRTDLLLHFPLATQTATKLVAIESRGFIFGGMLANTLGVGLVLARKAGKLPGKVVNSSYDTEYSSDGLELQVSSIKFGDKVIIHDDILATGGTVLAIKGLVESLGGEVIGYSFIGKIGGLNGDKRLGDLPIANLYTF